MSLFLDTKIVVSAFDRSDPTKQRISQTGPILPIGPSSAPRCCSRPGGYSPGSSPHPLMSRQPPTSARLRIARESIHDTTTHLSRLSDRTEIMDLDTLTAYLRSRPAATEGTAWGPEH